MPSTSPIRTIQTRVWLFWASLRQSLPLLAELVGELVVGRAALLVEGFGALPAIPADGGGINQHLGRCTGEFDEIHQLLGQQPAAIAEQLFARIAPASGGDGLTRQIDHCIHVIEVIEPVQAIDHLNVMAEQDISAAALPTQYHHLVIDLEMSH